LDQQSGTDQAPGVEGLADAFQGLRRGIEIRTIDASDVVAGDVRDDEDAHPGRVRRVRHAVHPGRFRCDIAGQLLEVLGGHGTTPGAEEEGPARLGVIQGL
jgi:hypothetical protein